MISALHINVLHNHKNYPVNIPQKQPSISSQIDICYNSFFSSWEHKSAVIFTKRSLPQVEPNGHLIYMIVFTGFDLRFPFDTGVCF